MRAFSPRMFPATVAVWPLSTAVGTSGGDDEDFPEAAGSALPCRVRFSNQRAVVAADGESSLTPTQVAFPADPGVKIGDQLRTAAGRKLRVLGPAQDRGGPGLFVVVCQEVD